jgi:hypothetical protein
MQSQKETRPTLRAQPLVNDMRYIHIAVFALPPMEGRFRKVMLAADRLNRLVGIGLTKNADDLFGAVVFLLHESTP